MSKRKFPRSIKLLGQEWLLRVERGTVGNDDSDFGRTDINDQQITLFTLPHERYPKRGTIEQTLLHEIFHTSLASSGISNLLDDKLEEAIVDALERAVFPLIQQGLFTVDKKRK